MYTAIDPFEDDGNDLLAKICQARLASLRFSSHAHDATNIGIDIAALTAHNACGLHLWAYTQAQIFFSLLSSVALSFDKGGNNSGVLDALLVVLWVIPFVLTFLLMVDPPD